MYMIQSDSTIAEFTNLYCDVLGEINVSIWSSIYLRVHWVKAPIFPNAYNLRNSS